MELIENLLQLLVTFAGACLAGFAYWKSRAQKYFLLFCFYGCFALGALYWTLYLLLFGATPRVFYVSEFGWVASMIFLRILQATLSGPDERAFRCRVVWLAPLVGVPLMVFYCTYGDILSNLIWCGMMIALSFCSIRGLAYARRQTGAARDMRHFHTAVLCFAASEYLLWTAGCFWQNDSLASPAFWCDILLTLAILGLLPATRKAVCTGPALKTFSSAWPRRCWSLPCAWAGGGCASSCSALPGWGCVCSRPTSIPSLRRCIRRTRLPPPWRSPRWWRR